MKRRSSQFSATCPSSSDVTYFNLFSSLSTHNRVLPFQSRLYLHGAADGFTCRDEYLNLTVMSNVATLSVCHPASFFDWLADIDSTRKIKIKRRGVRHLGLFNLFYFPYVGVKLWILFHLTFETMDRAISHVGCSNHAIGRILRCLFL